MNTFRITGTLCEDLPFILISVWTNSEVAGEMRRLYAHVMPPLCIHHFSGPSEIIQNGRWVCFKFLLHYSDVIMGVMASQITSLTIVYSTVYPGANQRKHQSSASLAIVRRIHRWPVHSPNKGPVTRKIFPFDDVIMKISKTVPIKWKFHYHQM